MCKPLVRLSLKTIHEMLRCALLLELGNEKGLWSLQHLLRLFCIKERVHVSKISQA